MSRALQLTGQEFGWLTALAPVSSTPGRKYAVWKCMCRCGAIKDVSTKELLRGHRKSCGCMPRGPSQKYDKSYRRERQRIYYQTNKEKIINRSAVFAAKNREKVRGYKKKYSSLNQSKERLRLKAHNSTSRKLCADTYIRRLLTMNDPWLRAMDIPKPLIEAKRDQLVLRRLARQLKQASLGELNETLS